MSTDLVNSQCEGDRWEQTEKHLPDDWYTGHWLTKGDTGACVADHQVQTTDHKGQHGGVHARDICLVEEGCQHEGRGDDGEAVEQEHEEEEEETRMGEELCDGCDEHHPNDNHKHHYNVGDAPRQPANTGSRT